MFLQLHFTAKKELLDIRSAITHLGLDKGLLDIRTAITHLGLDKGLLDIRTAITHLGLDKELLDIRTAITHLGLDKYFFSSTSRRNRTFSEHPTRPTSPLFARGRDAGTEDTEQGRLVSIRRRCVGKLPLP
jgi:hypothetical protein